MRKWREWLWLFINNYYKRSLPIAVNPNHYISNLVHLFHYLKVRDQSFQFTLSHSCIHQNCQFFLSTSVKHSYEIAIYELVISFRSLFVKLEDIVTMALLGESSTVKKERTICCAVHTPRSRFSRGCTK